jgi:glycosyltransferase involved in cell wall biosynthesis
MMVSVVIATRNRELLLAGALEGLARQTWPADRMEVVIADNGSTDGTRAVVDVALATGSLAIRYLNVTTPGKSHAVNAALKEARGDIIALTDDDVVPDARWIEQLVSAFEASDVDFVAGRITPRWESPPPSWLSPALYGVLAIPDNGDASRRIDDANRDVMPIGANMAIRSEVVARIGGFRVDLGKLDGTLRTGEDHEFFLRMLAAGFKGVYCPSAVVSHLAPQSRLTPQYFVRWMYQNGQDVARLDVAHPTAARRFAGAPRYLWREAALDAWQVIFRVISADRRGAFAALVRLVWFGGYIRAAIALAADRRRGAAKREATDASVVRVRA